MISNGKYYKVHLWFLFIRYLLLFSLSRRSYLRCVHREIFLHHYYLCSVLFVPECNCKKYFYLHNIYHIHMCIKIKSFLSNKSWMSCTTVWHVFIVDNESISLFSLFQILKYFIYYLEKNYLHSCDADKRCQIYK